MKTATENERTAKHTPTPWKLVQDGKWPFNLAVVGADGEIVASVQRIANSTRQNTLAECLDAVGFDVSDRDAIREALQRQVADFELFASAPSLLAQRDALLGACKGLLGDLLWYRLSPGGNWYECKQCLRCYDAEDEPPTNCADDCPGEIARAAIALADAEGGK